MAVAGGTGFAIAFFGAGIAAFFVAVASTGPLFFVLVAVVDPAFDLVAGLTAGFPAAALVVAFVAGAVDPVLLPAAFTAGVPVLPPGVVFAFTPAGLL